MEYRTIKTKNGEEIKLSRIILGGSSVNMKNGTYPDSFFDQMLKNGINTVDLARVYGNGRCEEFFGDYLSRRNRNDFTIISKCCHPLWGIFKRVDRKAAFKDIEDTLHALKTDHVDILLLHRDNPRIPASKIITFMNEIVQMGYAKAIGVSNWSLDRVIQANLFAKQANMVPFTVVENQYSLVERVKDSWHNGAKSFNQDYLSYLKDENIIPICYSSLAEGYLSGKIPSDDESFHKSLKKSTKVSYDYPQNLERLKRAETMAKDKNLSVPTIALSYVLSNESQPCAIVSMSSEKRIKSNVETLDTVLDLNERESLFLN